VLSREIKRDMERVRGREERERGERE